MQFDDRLATVLRQPVAGEAIARIQYRQLVDLLSDPAFRSTEDQLDAGYIRLSELAGTIPADRRARILREAAVRLREPRLVAHLAQGESQVAAAVVEAAALDEDQWIDLIPALPVWARASVRNRRDLGHKAEALLARLGIADRGLPSAGGAQVSDGAGATPSEPATATVLDLASASFAVEPVIADKYTAEPVACATAEPATGAPGGNGEAIGAIVRRIEAFRKARSQLAKQPDNDGGDDDLAPRLPLGDMAESPLPRGPVAFNFTTDAKGRIVWSDESFAPMAVGLTLASRDPAGPVRGALAELVARRQPLRAMSIEIDGAPAISGHWLVDAAPRFDRPNGAFIGYAGRMRRLPAADQHAEAEQGDSRSDRMRQILHELRTPVNAIQGFAEMIHQQLFGPTPHEYRALAAAIASDSAHILAGFDELDRLVRLDSGALDIETGMVDLDAVVASAVALLATYTGPRGGGFDYAASLRHGALTVAIERNEAERLIWRLLAAVAGACVPGESVRLRSRQASGVVRLSIRLPEALAALDEAGLFEAAAGGQSQALSAGAFGTGFALRLARAEARAAGGSLMLDGRKLRLALPAFNDEALINMA